MSTSPLSSLSLHQKLDLYFGVRHQDLRKLGQALESGDLAGAQQDYAAIQHLGQRGPFPSGDAFLNSGRQQDFEAIGSALQSGDLSAARQAFEQLKSSFQPPVPQPAAAVPGDNGPGIGSGSGSLSVKA